MNYDSLLDYISDTPFNNETVSHWTKMATLNAVLSTL